MKYRDKYGSWAGNEKGFPPDFNLCAESVCGNERGAMFHQCFNKARHDLDENGKPTTCKIHSKAYRDEKRRKSDEKYKQYLDDRRIPNNAHAFHEALVEIAGGHNDPRGLAMTTLAKATA